MELVRSKSGAADAEDFSSGLGSPIVIDEDTGACYVVTVAGTIKQIGKPDTGSWTPADGSGAGLSFVGAAGTYIKSGTLVIAQCTVVYPATANGANAIIGGLPFTIGASNAVAACYTTDGTATVALGAATTALVALVAAAGAAARTNANLSGDTVAFTLAYEV